MKRGSELIVVSGLISEIFPERPLRQYGPASDGISGVEYTFDIASVALTFSM